MSAKKTLTIVGGVSTTIGGMITAYGLNKYLEAKSMINALVDGDVLFGGDSSTTQDIWNNHMGDAKIMLIIGSVILIIGIILLISGILSKKNTQLPETANEISHNEDSSKDNLLEQFKELDKLKKAGYISDEEYESKRKKMLGL